MKSTISSACRTLVRRGLAIAVATALMSGAAMAQGKKAEAPPPAPKQMALTEKQVEGYIAAQKDMNAIAEAQEKSKKKADPKASQAQFEDAAKKSGFAGLDEFASVAFTVNLVMQGIDPETKAFSEPPEAIKKQIEEVKADKNMPAKDKTQTLKSLAEELKTAQVVEHKGNVEIVKKYYDKIAPSSN